MLFNNRKSNIRRFTQGFAVFNLGFVKLFTAKHHCRRNPYSQEQLEDTRMKIWKFSLLVGLAIPLVIFVFSRIVDQSDQELYIELVDNIRGFIVYLGINLLVVFNVFFSCAVAGFLFYHVIQFIDSMIDKHLDLTIIQRVLFATPFALLITFLYTQIFRISLAEQDTWIRSAATATYLGWQPWTGEFTISPVLWSFYGFFTFILGFLISPKIMQYLRAFHTLRLRNSTE
jgi:hypothetical protein